MEVDQAVTGSHDPSLIVWEKKRSNILRLICHCQVKSLAVLYQSDYVRG